MASATISSDEFFTQSKASLGSISTLHYPIDLGSGRHGNYINFFIHTPQKSTYKQSPGQSSFTQTPGFVGPQPTVFDSNNNQSNATQSISKQNLSAFTSDVVNNIPTNLGALDSSSISSSVNKGLDTISGGWLNLGGNGTNLINSGTNILNDVLNSVPEATQNTLNFILGGSSTQLTDVISLYMPDTVSSTQSMSYETASLTDALGILGLGGSTISSAFDTAEKTGFNSQTLKSLASNPNAIEIATGGISGNKTGTFSNQTSLQKIALNRVGYALNPQIQVIFKAIDFRTFQYDFQFNPNSQEEADTVTKIIKTFKFHSAPDIGAGSIGRYFVIPSTFDIEYMMSGGQANQNLHKISTCVLQTVSVDYAPRGFVTYDDGMPVQTRMTLQFQETEIMNKQRISEGY